MRIPEDHECNPMRQTSTAKLSSTGPALLSRSFLQRRLPGYKRAPPQRRPCLFCCENGNSPNVPVAFLLCLYRLGADLGHLHSAGALRARYQDDEVSTRCPLHQPDHARFPAPSLRLKRIRPPFRPLAPLRLLRSPPCRVGACLRKGTYAE